MASFASVLTLGFLLVLASSMAKELDLSKDDEWLVAYNLFSRQTGTLKVYLFNYTNPEEFLQGEKPRLQEVGPYIYRFAWLKERVEWPSDGEVSFLKNKDYRFVPWLSEGFKETDKIVTPNMPLVSALNSMRDKPAIAKAGLGALIGALKEKPFYSLTVGEALWGKQNTLIDAGRAVITDPSKRYPYKEFGLLAGTNRTEGRTSISSGLTPGKGYLGQINNFEGFDKAGIWRGNSECRKSLGSLGLSFKPNLKKNEEVRLFHKEFCSGMPFHFEKEVTHKNGIRAMRFTPSIDTMVDAQLPCNCIKGSCEASRRGMYNISLCNHKAPLLMSMPRFLDADPYYFQSVEGLNQPDREEHESFVDITSVGASLKSRTSFQLNLAMERVDDVKQAKGLRDYVLPLAYFVHEVPNHFRHGDDIERLRDIIARRG